MALFKKQIRPTAGRSGTGRYKWNAKSPSHETILSLIPDIIMEADFNRTYTWANKPGFDFFGDDVIGRQADYYFVEKQEIEIALAPLFTNEEDTVYVESWQRRKDGNKRLLAWWCKAVRNQHGKVTGTVSTARDITAEKNNEYNLLERTVELESFFTYSCDLLCIADIYGNFRRLGQQWEKVLGYPVKELMGRKFIELVHPDDVAATVEASSDTSDPKGVANFRNRYKHKDGSYRLLQWNSVRIGTAIYATARDVTEEIQILEAMKSSDALYRNLVRNSPVVNYQLDRAGIFLQSEGKGLEKIGLTPGQVVGMSIYELYKDYPEICLAFENALKGEHVHFIITVAGRWFESLMEPVLEADGTISSVVGVSVDQTERQEAEEQTRKLMDQLEKEKKSKLTT